MSNAYPEGPLDDYFRDESDDFNTSLSPSLPHELSGRPLDAEMKGSETSDSTGLSHDHDKYETAMLANHRSSSSRSEREKGWTGVMPNESGPSTRFKHTGGWDEEVPGKFPSPTASTIDTETFAERFKYLICSSGLLEKDYVPALSGGMEEEPTVNGNKQDGGGIDWEELDTLVKAGRERWDLTLAAVCLVIGLVLALGAWALLGTMVVLGGSGAWFIRIKSTEHDEGASTPVSESGTAQDRALASLITFLSQSHSLNSTLSSSLTLLEPHPYNLQTYYQLRITLHRLTGNMTDHLATATSTLLELTDRRELGILGEMYDIPVVGSFFYSRRHRTAESSSDDESDANGPNFGSDDIQSPRKQELSCRPSSPSPRLLGQARSPSDAPHIPSSPLRQLHTHSHRTQHLSLVSARDMQDRFTQLPDRTPRLSKRTSLDRLGNPWSASRIVRPRHERRITEADEDEVEDEISEKSQSSRSSSNEETSFTPLHPLKAGAISSPTSSIPETVRKVPRTPTLTRDTPRGSPSPFQHVSSPLARRFSTASEGLQPLRTAALFTPSRTRPSSLLGSPLDRGSPTVPLSSAPLRAALSLDPVSSQNPKRRSLQNMPYYHSSDDDGAVLAGSSGLTRTRSMPLSDLQALRTASSTGSRSRRASYNLYPDRSPNLSPNPATSFQIGLGIGMGRPQSFHLDKRSSMTTLADHSNHWSLNLARVDSVSPLTAPALKASCLGIHLKRRRMTCCLLGLRFGAAQNESYWEDVKSVLDLLVEGMVKERNALEEVYKETEREYNTAAVLDSMRPTTTRPGSSDDSWSQSPVDTIFPSFSQKGDFAPRTSDEALLLSSIDGMASALVKTYVDLTHLREGLMAGEQDKTKVESWANVRSKLGECVREWEKGREVLGRINSDHLVTQDHRPGELERRDGGLPEFLKGWDDGDADVDGEGEGDTSQSTSLQTDRDDEDLHPSILENDHPNLPPVGKDTIFEGVSIPVLSDEKTILGKMSREERIHMTKEAREQGLTLSQLLLQRVIIGNASSERTMDGARKDRDQEMRMKGGLVVDELRGVIGVIRRMKEGETTVPTSGAPAVAEQPKRSEEQQHEAHQDPSATIDAGKGFAQANYDRTTTKLDIHADMLFQDPDGISHDNELTTIISQNGQERNDNDQNENGTSEASMGLNEIAKHSYGTLDLAPPISISHAKEGDGFNKMSLDLGELKRSFRFSQREQEAMGDGLMME